MSNLGDSCRRIVAVHDFSYENRDDCPFGGDQANPGSCLGFQVVEIIEIRFRLRQIALDVFQEMPFKGRVAADVVGSMA